MFCFYVGVSALIRGRRGFPDDSLVKNLPANAGDARYVGSIPGLGRSLGGGHGNPLQYSCLENLVDRAGCKESDTTEATELTAQHSTHTHYSSGNSTHYSASVYRGNNLLKSGYMYN